MKLILLSSVPVLLLAIDAAVHGQAPITKPTVSEKACPAVVISVTTPDKHQARAVVRKPPGKGPFPALVHLHGGLDPRPVKALTQWSLNNVTSCRFLAAGYVTVEATFRSRKEDPQTRDALVDCLAILAAVKNMPEVDAKSVVIWGDSGGGSLALELAGEMEPCAVAAQEPATVLMSGMFSNASLGKPGSPQYKKNWNAILANPTKYYTPELKHLTEEKIRKIACPVFIAHGDKAAINRINHEIIIPALKDAGKKVEVILYPGQPHGFSHGSGTPEAAKKFFEDADAFFRRYLKTRPMPLQQSLISQTSL